MAVGSNETNKVVSKTSTKQKVSALVAIKKSSNFARRLRDSSKKQQISVKDKVSFIYDGKKEVGIVRYIGSTNFSAGKWCGIEVAKGVGKHNGTVKGKRYFTVADTCGVFVPLQKVSNYQPPTTEAVEKSDKKPAEISDDMRITLKSVKSPHSSVSSSTLLIDKDTRVTPCNGTHDSSLEASDYATGSSTSRSSFSRSSDSGIESPTRKLSEKCKDTLNSFSNQKLNQKNGAPKSSRTIVISSFTTPLPEKAVIKASVSEPDITKAGLQIKYIETLKKAFKSQEGLVALVHEPQLQQELLAEDFSQVELHSSETIYNNKPGKAPRANAQRSFDEIDNDDVFKKDKPTVEHIEKEIEDHSSKIPRKVNISALITKHNENISKNKTTIPVRKKPSFKGTLTSVPPKVRIRKGSGNEKTSGEQKEKGVSTGVVRRSNVSSTVNAKSASSHDEPGFVMGNSNATHPGLHKKNFSGCESDVQQNALPGDNLQKEVKDAVVLERKSSKTKSKLSFRSNSIAKDSKLKGSKDLQKEIDDLKNQLKERSDRITELEVTIKNNNNVKQLNQTQLEEVHASTQNELNTKQEAIALLEDKLSFAETQITKSSNGLQALSIVIQYYIDQIEIISVKLSTERSEKHALDQKNEHLCSENYEIKKHLDEATQKLDAAKCQCEQLKRELESVQLSNESALKALKEQFEQDQEQIKLSVIQEKEKEIENIFSNHNGTIEKLNENHTHELTQLKLLNDHQFQELKKENENTLTKQQEAHDQLLEGIKAENFKASETLQRRHDEKCNELQRTIDTVVAEKQTINEKLSEVMRELENDTKVQAAVSQYKHLPAELESLQVVVDLKNEELKTLRVKCMEMEKKMDEYYDLQNKHAAISQQNQSLTELLKKKSHAERRVSIERDSLLEKFERETRKVSQLSMEKEQLIWRASNPDLSRSPTNVFDEEEEEDSPPSPLRHSTSLSTTPPKKTVAKQIKRRSMNF